MKVVVTCGPSYEPIDRVRRITNFSTGRLGVTLAEHLAGAGHDVVCLKGEQATWPGPSAGVRLEAFSTNDDLADRLRRLGTAEAYAAVFHAAALCDYRVARATRPDGTDAVAPKLASRAGGLVLHLSPATKILPLLREWFPGARIIGWKYELSGTPDDAMARAWHQIRECRTDGCVLNGTAWGPGFAFCRAEGTVTRWASLAELCAGLERWLAAIRQAPTP